MADTTTPDVANPPAPGVVHPHPQPPRHGDLTTGWRVVVAVTWIAVAGAFAAVWGVSVQLGLSTWWLGPRGDPQPRAVQFVPFVPPMLMVVAVVNRIRPLPWLGLAASASIGAIAAFDVDRVVRLALVEFAIAGAAALVSIASFSGRYRPARGSARNDDG